MSNRGRGVSHSRGSQFTHSRGRRVPHTSKSCIPCRDRKTRCIPGDSIDENVGTPVRCKSCIHHGLDCIWGFKEDGRSANSKTALESQIARLKLAEHDLKLKYDQLVHHCSLLPGFSPPTMALQPINMGQLSTMSQHRLVPGPNGLHLFAAPLAFYLRHSPAGNPVVPLPANALSPPPLPLDTLGRTMPWYRFLPMETVLLSEVEHLELLDLFFSYFPFWGLRCHRDLFQHDMQAALSSTKSCTLNYYSPMLHNAILAVATAYSDNPRLKNKDARMAFAKKAERYVNGEIRNPTLSGVQAMSHLSTFYTGIGELLVGANFFSMCASMARALGLGVDASEFVRAKTITEQEKHDRDRLFWTIFLQDKMEALNMGSDILIPKPRDVGIPKFLHGEPLLNAGLFKEQITLCSIVSDIFRTWYCKSTITHDDMSELIDAVESWRDDLPRSMRLADQATSAASQEKILLHLAFYWINLVLHYPLYQATSSLSIEWNQKAVNNCDLSASWIIHLLENCGSLRQMPLLAVHAAFSAGMALISQMERLVADNFQKQAISDKFTKCKAFLDQMAFTWDCATNNKKILEDLYSQSPSNLFGSSLTPTQSQCSGNQGHGYFVQNPSTSPMLPIAIEPPSTAPLPNYSGLHEFESMMPRSDSLLDMPMRFTFQDLERMVHTSDLALLNPQVFHSPQSFNPPPLPPELASPGPYWPPSPSTPQHPGVAPSTFSPHSVGSSSIGRHIQPSFSTSQVTYPSTSQSPSANAPPLRERGMRKHV